MEPAFGELVCSREFGDYKRGRGITSGDGALAQATAGTISGSEIRFHDAFWDLQPVGLHRVVAAGRRGLVGQAG